MKHNTNTFQKLAALFATCNTERAPLTNHRIGDFYTEIFVFLKRIFTFDVTILFLSMDIQKIDGIIKRRFLPFINRKNLIKKC